jgi:signal transduction histidine kinase
MRAGNTAPTLDPMRALATRLASHVRRSDILDAAGAAVLVLSTIAVSINVSHGERAGTPLDWFAYTLIVVAMGSLAVRRRWPLVVLAIVTACLVAYGGRDYVGGPIFISSMFAIYSMAAQRERRVAIPAALIATGIVAICGMLWFKSGPDWWMLLFASWSIAALLLGDSVRNRRAYLAGLEARARNLEETREEEARRRVAEERLRIARELHDVVAHSLATINVQAGVAAHVIDRQPERGREALLNIKQASKRALSELRETLHVLRQGDEAAPLAPGPCLDQLDTLVAAATRAGVRVDVERLGSKEPLSPTVDAAAYRIIQESLTNVMRHADATQARISVIRVPDALELEIVDDGVGVNGSASTENGGHGIAGMRERAALLGGRVEVGPAPQGGFRVRAWLPEGEVRR